MKKLFFVIIWNVGLMLIFFLLCEIGIRYFVPEIQPQATSRSIVVDSLYHATHGLRSLSSGTTNGVLVMVDAFGFRKSTVEVDTSKASWLLLGDSVTFGPGVADDSTFAARLQTHLNSVNILNSAAIGYNINCYRDLFHALVIAKQIPFQIDRVLLFWCLNDVYSNVPDFDTPGGKMRFLFADGLRWLRTHSRLYYLLKTLLFDRPKSYYLFDAAFYQPENPEFRNAHQILLEMNQLCREKNIDFHLILLPYEYQLRTGDFKPQQFIMQMLADEIQILFPFQSNTRPEGNSKALFLYGDGIHFSNLGHRYVAEFLVNYFGK